MRRKIYWSVISLLLLVVTLTVGTYAWMQMNNFNMLEGIEFRTSAGDRLELSLDGSSYEQTITSQALGKQIKNTNLKDVTTSDGLNFYVSHYETKAQPDHHFIQFDLWFRVKPTQEEKNKNLVLDRVYLTDRDHVSYENHSLSENTYAVSKGSLWKSPIDFDNGKEEVKKGEAHRYHAADAIRIGFYNEEQQFIYDPSEDETRGFGKAYGALDYFQKTTNQKLTPPEAPSTVYGLTQKDPSEPQVALDDSSLVSVLKLDADGYYKGKTTVSIWIEGWDADSFDAIIKDEVYVQLRFTALRKRILT